MRILILILAALPVIAAECTTLTSAGKACAGGSCSFSAMQASDWSCSKIPGTGDNVYVSNGVVFTFDSDVEIGDYAGQAFRCESWGSGTATIKIAQGATVITRGHSSICQGGLEIRGELAQNAVANGNTTNYQLFYGTGTSPITVDGGVIRAATAAETGSVKSKSWGIWGHTDEWWSVKTGAAFIASNGARIEDVGAGGDGFAFYFRDPATVNISDTTLSGNDLFYVRFAAATDFRFVRSSFLNPTHTVDTASGYGFSFEQSADRTSGTRLLQDAVIQGGTFATSVNGLTLNHVFAERKPTNVGWGLNWGASQAYWSTVDLIDDLFFWMPALENWHGPQGLPAGGVVQNLVALWAPALDNPHAWMWGAETTNVLQDSLLETMGVSVGGDGYQVAGQIAEGAATFTRNMLLAPPESQGPPFLLNQSDTSNLSLINVAADWNTYMSLGAGEPGMGIGVQLSKDVDGLTLYSSLRGNFAWWPTVGLVPISYSGIGTQRIQQTAGADWNAVWNTNDATQRYVNTSQADAWKNPSPPGANDTVNVPPRFVDASRRYVFAPTDLLGMSGTAWTAGSSGAHQSYAVGDVVSHGFTGYYAGKAILWKCVQAHDAFATPTAEPGYVDWVPTYPTLGWVAYWEPLIVDLLRQDMSTGQRYSGYSCAGDCSLNTYIWGWIKNGMTPQNPQFWCASREADGTPRTPGSQSFCAQAKAMIGAI